MTNLTEQLKDGIANEGGHCVSWMEVDAKGVMNPQS